MLNRDFCNNGKCSECSTSCALDMSIPCSPDCPNLTSDGMIFTKKCIESGCDAINIVFGTDDNEEIIEQYGEISTYPYDV